jgi:ATP-binding cassette, subfamily B, bacterial MsbA
MPVRVQFAIGVFCGLMYSLASGLGMPLVVKVVLPVLFHSKDKEEHVVKKASHTFMDNFEFWKQLRASGEHMLQTIPQERLVLITCLWIPVIFLIRAISGFSNSYLIQYTGLRVVEGIRTDVFRKLQSLPLSFYHKNRSGDLLARIISDSSILQQVIAQSSSDLIKQPATLISALASIVIISIVDSGVFFALIAFLSVPCCVFIIRTAGKRLAAKAKMLQKAGGDLSALLAESLQSPLEIRAYNLEDHQVNSFTRHVKKMIKLSMKVVRYRQIITPSIEFVAAIGFAFALYQGWRHHMNLESFVSLGMALFMAYEPVKKLGNIHSLFKQADSAAARLEHVLYQEDSMPDPGHPQQILPGKTEVVFEGVSFAYDEDEVLKSLDLTFPVGQVVALVGPSGAGKTTFAQMLPRLYDPTKGRITLGGVDLKDLRKADLRGQIAVVPQMPALFSGTLADNIRMGRQDATDEEVREAARLAYAAEFIEKLPDGYNTVIGERGSGLSGGQRQRIAIARAFLKNAPILILDEATSALDSESEARVQLALADLVQGRTTFLIAHRFSTLAVAQRILLFSEGRVIADGSHDELYQSNALYRAMYDHQTLTA